MFSRCEGYDPNLHRPRVMKMIQTPFDLDGHLKSVVIPCRFFYGVSTYFINCWKNKKTINETLKWTSLKTKLMIYMEIILEQGRFGAAKYRDLKQCCCLEACLEPFYKCQLLMSCLGSFALRLVYGLLRFLKFALRDGGPF